MEVLNNIWYILSTENIFLSKFLTAITVPIEVYISFCYFTQILKITYNKSQKYKYIISFSIFAIINSLFIPNPYNVFLNYFVLFMLTKYIFNLNILKTILAVILPLIIFGLVSSLIMNPFLKLFGITFEKASNIPIYKFIYLCISYIILYFILLAIRHINFQILLDIDLRKKTIRTILVNLILGILILFIQAIINFYYINEVPIIFTLFNFGLLFAYFFFNFYSLVKTTKLDMKTMELENSESYNNSLTVLYDNVRGFKHDFDNMVNTISGYLKVDDINGLKKYFSTFEKECDSIKNVQMLNPNIINNPGIYNLIVAKYQKAINLNVKINFDFFFDFDNLHMPIYEFSRILGILLDNAIESAKECKNKEVSLLFRDSVKQHVQIISIENTYLDKKIDTNKIFEKGISGKENHSGVGLWEVNQIIKRNNNIILNTSKDEELFKQELQIYY